MSVEKRKINATDESPIPHQADVNMVSDTWKMTSCCDETGESVKHCLLVCVTTVRVPVCE